MQVKAVTMMMIIIVSLIIDRKLGLGGYVALMMMMIAIRTVLQLQLIFAYYIPYL